METQERIGIFDSGIGGISILNQLLNSTISECIYIADTAYLPYGEQSRKVLLERGRVITNTLLSYNITTIIVACHTSSATALPTLKKEFPQVTFIDMLAPTVIAAASLTQNYKIGVIATTTTITNHSHKTILKKIAPNIELFEQACPLLVPLVEKQELTTKKSKTIISEYLKPLLEKNIDTLILGCTHYAFLEKAIKQSAPELSLISAQGCIIVKDTKNTTCNLTFLTSDTKNYSHSIIKFLEDQNTSIKFDTF